MATKSYKLKLDLRANQDVVDTDHFQDRALEISRVRRWLDDTREAFNEGVDYLTVWLLKMHRGAGVCREKRDGIWREWQEITTVEQLGEARRRKLEEPHTFALLENFDLLKIFVDGGKSESEAVRLAECCRGIAKGLCPASDDNNGAQMPRDSLDLLLNPNSDARGVRFNKIRFHWKLVEIARAATNEQTFQSEAEAFRQQRASNDRDRLQRWTHDIVEKAKGKSGDWNDTIKSLINNARRPEWLRNEAIAKQAEFADSLDELLANLETDSLFAEDAGTRRLARIRKSWETKQRQETLDWPALRNHIIEEAQSDSGDFQRLAEAGCLPLPDFGTYHSEDDVSLGTLRLMNVGGEWKRAMWDMAGQRIRSHLGWVRRRTKERMLWELRTKLFNDGGWIRTHRNGEKIKRNDLTSDDFRFSTPQAVEFEEFEVQPAYGNRKWVCELCRYESDEMTAHLEEVAFGAADQPRILKRTAKGWVKVRDKWKYLLAKAEKNRKPTPSTGDLMDAFDEMRNRKNRDFGDRRLFEWLADPIRRSLWDGSDQNGENDCGREDRDCLSAFVAHNEHLADSPNSITFTRSDPVRHPVWPYFGENSAVKYRLKRAGDGRLVLILAKLLHRQADGSYSSENNVLIALRGYEDFERSFILPDGHDKIKATDTVTFRDDLLGEETREGTLSGIKLTWDRDELQAAARNHNASKASPRIFATFSCDAGNASLPEWLNKYVGSEVKFKTPRDGITKAFYLKKEIRMKSNKQFVPGQRQWPKEAIEQGFAVRGTDLGFRVSSAGTVWRLSFDRPADLVAWQVGFCGTKPVYAVVERTSTVSLPGDRETLPLQEQMLRHRLYSLRTRLNLNNALLRTVRLLTLEEIAQHKPDGQKTRKRSDGTTKRVGVRWKAEVKKLSDEDQRRNCHKACQQLLRWSTSDALRLSLGSIGFHGTLWDYLAQHNSLKDLVQTVPTTVVPSEKDAEAHSLDREHLKKRRDGEVDAFIAKVFELRQALAKTLCDSYDAVRQYRAASGLWYEFDAAMIKELSYGDRGQQTGRRRLLEDGLLRLLRKPPVTKHRDRKDGENNLPHGETHRGGLSMVRLNFLDDVKNFVRRWTCRPRWPGDVRRVPRDAKVDRCDTEHLDHLREHRAKLIAHADVAQTLGFEQDLRRGLWLYEAADSRDNEVWHRPERQHLYQWQNDRLVKIKEGAPSHPVRAYEPAHVLVYEDLTRYKMSSDRPKSENAGLSRWSHRRILSFSQHIGDLFGVPVATVDARFSSRFCSHCGAPGARAVRFDPNWLDQVWMQRVLQSTDVRDAAMKSIACKVKERLSKEPAVYDSETNRPWVLRDGGGHFVCANRDCGAHGTPIDADENAAANIGLRFLRGVEGLRVSLSSNGTILKSIGYLDAGLRLIPAEADLLRGSDQFWLARDHGESSSESNRIRRNQKQDAVEENANGDEDAGDLQTLFRDPSGTFLPNNRWFEGKVFWRAVARSCSAGINGVNASFVGSEADD